MQPVRAGRFPDRYLAAKPAVVRTAVPVRDVRLARSRRRRCRLLPPTSTYLELLVGRTSRREVRRTPRRRRPRAQRQFHFGSGVERERRRSRVDGEFQVFRVTVVSPDFARRWFRPGRVRRRAARDASSRYSRRTASTRTPAPSPYRAVQVPTVRHWGLPVWTPKTTTCHRRPRTGDRRPGSCGLPVDRRPGC